MKVVCAWCQERMPDKEPLEDETISHGLCGPCMAVVLEESCLQSTPKTLECRGLDAERVVQLPSGVGNSDETTAVRNAPLDDGSVDDGAGPAAPAIYS